MGKRSNQHKNGPNSLLFMVSSRDRMAPDCAIRHPVWPIVALQRRMRFSARLAWFFKIRCHQRRAIRPEQASFSVLVSNLDFRVPRLRQIGERALTGPCGWREKRPPERLRIEAGRSRLQGVRRPSSRIRCHSSSAGRAGASSRAASRALDNNSWVSWESWPSEPSGNVAGVSSSRVGRSKTAPRISTSLSPTSRADQ